TNGPQRRAATQTTPAAAGRSTGKQAACSAAAHDVAAEPYREASLIVAIARRGRGAIRGVVAAALSATQTDPAPTATAPAPFPAGIASVSWLVEGSMRASVLASAPVTQTAPSPTAT